MADDLPESTAFEAAVAACDTTEALAEASAALPGIQVALLARGTPYAVMARALTAATDALTRRLLQIAERALAPSPPPYAWLACGSQARREQTVVSDQDNAMLLPDELTPAGADSLAELARAVNDGLDACGYPRCRGGVMASNATWRRSRDGWRRHFDGWIDRPTMHALMHATIFFDMRVVAGDEAPLREIREHVRDRVYRNEIFLSLLARNAVQSKPPLGVLGKLAVVRAGERRGTFDVKKGGVMAIVDLARVHALAAGSTALTTLDRLRDAASERTLSASGAEELVAAFELAGAVRARHQARLIGRGERPDNFIRPEELGAGELGALEEAFRVIRRHQRVLANRYPRQ